MKVPLSWLQEFLPVELKVDDFVNRLTFSGVEVEGVETVGGGLDALIVGEVLGVEPHPAADRLRVCRVYDGEQERQVVCGAPNVAVGQKAAFAPAGAVMPDGTRLKKVRLRGVESHGMLCAEDELGLSDAHTGIMVLDSALKAGTPLTQVLGEAETVVDLEITWNRPDLLCITGIARELAALYEVPFKLPECHCTESGCAVEALTAVDLQDTEGCPRYTARVVDNVEIKPSPLWMQRRLTLCGIRPINNVVDITNYVMLECGHPLHAFDYARLAENRIVVRRAAPGETITTLDGQSRQLSPEMTVIADAGKPVAVAGVMGGADSEIGADTKRVLLESATFAPERIHRTAVALNMQTESSRRYERQVNPHTVELAGRRAAMLLREYAGGSIASGVIDCYPAPVKPHKILFRFDQARALLGVEVDNRIMTGIFDRLGLVSGTEKNGTVPVTIPAYRPDLECEADLIEEVARMHGLDNIPENNPVCRLVGSLTDHAFMRRQELRSALAGLGLTEVMHYSFVSSVLLDRCGIAAEGRLVLPNPVNAEHAVMRPALLPQMIECLGRNRSRQVGAAALFEIGSVYSSDSSGATSEALRLSIGVMGPVGRYGLRGNKPPAEEDVFLWTKGILETLLERFIKNANKLRLEPFNQPWSEPERCFKIKCGPNELGCIGLLNKELRHNWRINDPVTVAELDLSGFMHEKRRDKVIQMPPVYPAVRRDVAFIAPLTMKHDDVLRVIRDNAPDELTAVDLFDIFSGEGISHGCKSMAYSLEYRSEEKTLTDDEANRLHDAVKDVLKNELKVELR